MKKGYQMALGLVLVLVLCLLTAACGGGATTTTAASTETTGGATITTVASTETTGGATMTSIANTSPIKIGIALSLTGDSAAPCTQIKEGFDSEIKYLNANGGMGGRQIEADYVDDQSKVDTATAAIQSLVDKKVEVIIGPFPQFCIPPARAVTEQAHVFHVSFGPPTIAELNEDQTKYTYSFETATGPDGEADAWVKMMVADGWTNVLGVADQIPIHQEGLTLLDTMMPEKGIAWTHMTDSWGLGETDLTPISNKIAAKVKEVKPDAIILASNPVHVNVIIKTLRSLGVTQPIYGGGAGSHPLVMLADAGNDPKDVAGDYAIGPAIVDPTRIPDTYPAKQDLVAFIERWQADNPQEPFASLFLGMAYDTLHVAKVAVEGAATLDADGYAAAMLSVDFWGAQGHYVYSATDHIGNHGGFMQWQYTDGQGFEFIRTLN
jgi:ABC-type branched-subunit amino acid transport system substrate-binding protein